jgi:hypothetical protein
MNLQCLFLLAVIVATAIGSTNVYGADDNQTQHDGVGVDEPKKPKIQCDADNCICDKDEKLVDGKCEPKDPEPPKGCDDSYPRTCIPSPPPDLDCGDVGYNIKVEGSDPHDLDRDGDGIGCEVGGEGNGGSNGGNGGNGGSNNDGSSSNNDNNNIPNNVNFTNNSITLTDGKNITTFTNGTIKISYPDGVITKFMIANLTISTYISYPNGSNFTVPTVCIPSPHNIAPTVNASC